MKFKEQDIVITLRNHKKLGTKGGYLIPEGTLGIVAKVYYPPCSVHYAIWINDLESAFPFCEDDLRPPFTCVYCGCTDAKACKGGCSWVETHKHTPTGVCSKCTASIVGLQRLDVGKFILIAPGAMGSSDKDKIWMEKKRGEGMNIATSKLETHLEKFFKKEF